MISLQALNDFLRLAEHQSSGGDRVWGRRDRVFASSALYAAADLKAAVTATGSTLKVAKDDVRAAKPAAKPAAKKAAQADAAHGPAKRRRTGKQS